MRRWNGWGDDTIDNVINADALEFLQQRIGHGTPPKDVTLAQSCKAVPPSRLLQHRMVDTSAELRMHNSHGQSLPDWLKIRFGKIEHFPDGVAFPESSEQVRELLSYAKACGAAVIPYGGGTSVVGHLTVPQSAQPVLSMNMSRLSDRKSVV